MEIELRAFATVRDAVGAKSLRREYDQGATVGDVLCDLEETYPGLEGRLLDADGICEHVTVLVNGRNVAGEAGVETVLEDGDRVGISPPVTGGDGSW